MPRPFPPDVIAAVIILIDKYGLTYREVSRQTGISESTIRAWVSKYRSGELSERIQMYIDDFLKKVEHMPRSEAIASLLNYVRDVLVHGSSDVFTRTSGSDIDLKDLQAFMTELRGEDRGTSRSLSTQEFHRFVASLLSGKAMLYFALGNELLSPDTVKELTALGLDLPSIPMHRKITGDKAIEYAKQIVHYLVTVLKRYPNYVKVVQEYEDKVTVLEAQRKLLLECAEFLYEMLNYIYENYPDIFEEAFNYARTKRTLDKILKKLGEEKRKGAS